jgi:elongation factor Ts
MEISAKMVKDLRECTGAGMMDCKKALSEAEGDVDQAVDILRTRGLAALAKRAGRATNEGVVAAFVSDYAAVGALIEVNCETDFVGRNAEFQTFANALAEQVAIDAPDGIAEGDAPLMTQQYKRNPSLTVEQALGEVVSKLGENMTISRFIRLEVQGSGAIGSYIHAGGRIGVLVEVGFGNAETAKNEALAPFIKDIAMHVAAASPSYVTRDQAPADVVEHELSIYRAQAAESGKPEQIQQKMAEGRLEKYFKEVALVEQPFVKNPDISVAQYAADTSKAFGDTLTVVGFERFVLGQAPTGDIV